MTSIQSIQKGPRTTKNNTQEYPIFREDKMVKRALIYKQCKTKRGGAGIYSPLYYPLPLRGRPNNSQPPFVIAASVLVLAKARAKNQGRLNIAQAMGHS